MEYKFYKKTNLGKKRSEMPQVDSENIDDLIIHFANKAKVSKVKIAIGKIKPSQEELDESKVAKFIKDKKKWKDRKYVISADNYLLDGHHSYAQGLEDDEKAEVTAYKVSLKAKDLISRTNKLKFAKKVDVNDKLVKSHGLVAYLAGNKVITELQKVQILATTNDVEKATKEMDALQRVVLQNKDGDKQTVYQFEGDGIVKSYYSQFNQEFLTGVDIAVNDLLDKHYTDHTFHAFAKGDEYNFLLKTDVDEIQCSWYMTKGFTDTGSIGIRMPDKIREKRIKNFSKQIQHEKNIEIVKAHQLSEGEQLYDKLKEFNE